ncbi:uncharacterized protein J4E87_008741 [Alternaria ethzedia]|uniref:uncharacterized protein n=1 Tax=Alternaria ethzedia TaxID=181014 RepID=UPI0020C27DB4|nr:uncharacterized protein J4E87_008741 [Alternaria ethzedia]KAI4616229.1 hypothetical protein J4E87_008741 [Alternaria ethzedia]
MASHSRTDSDRVREITIPQSAKEEFIALRHLGSGQEGYVVLAVHRSSPKTLASCVGLKFNSGEKVTSIRKSLLEKLKGMEGDRDHLIAAVHGYPDMDSPNWHALEYIPGHSIQDLLRNHKIYKVHGLPPCVIFHVFAELVRVQRHLKEHGYCHIDLKEGGNVMLSNKDDDVFPTVTLIDFGGIWPYNRPKEFEHTLYLARKMWKGNTEIAEHWRLEQFEEDRKQANDQCKMIHDRAAGEIKETDTLEDLWKECGKSFEELKQSLTDKSALKELRGALDDKKITEQDVVEGEELPLEEVWDVGIGMEYIPR